MKIGFDAKRAFHNKRGLGNYSRTLLEGLFQFFPENRYHLFTPPYLNKDRLWSLPDNHKVKIHTPTDFLGKMLPSVWRSLLLASDKNFNDLDIYHGLSHELPPWINRSKTKSIVTIHDLLFLRFPENFKMIDRIIYKKKFSRSCAQADRIIAICEQTKRDLIEYLNVEEQKIDVVYQSCHPIFFNRFSEEMKNGFKEKNNLPDEYLLYVGALEENKNLKNLIKGFSIFSQTSDASMVIVGRGRDCYLKELHQLIRDLGISTKVLFFNGVGFEELPLFYQCANCFIFPSFFEGFGIPIIEALASRTPVITSKGSCFPESGGPGSLYINPHRPEEIAGAMTKVMEDALFRDQITFQGQEHIRKFTLESATEKLFNVYKKTIDQ